MGGSAIAKEMGIGEISRFSGIIEPQVHGNISLETPTDSEAAEIIKISDRPCLLATTSHDRSQELGALVAGAT